MTWSFPVGPAGTAPWAVPAPALHGTWATAAAGCGLAPGPAAAARDDLLARWGSPSRRYHDLVHLAESVGAALELLDTPGTPDLSIGTAPVRDVVVMALWFHDAVHRGGHAPGRGPDDEACSARLAHDVLVGAGAGRAVADEVARLVELTRRHDPQHDDLPGAVVCDADLAVLAAPAPRYAAYVAGVRAEWSGLDDTTFARGRAEVLARFVARPHLFTTPGARRRWHAAARANLTAELRALTPGSPLLQPPGHEGR